MFPNYRANINPDDYETIQFEFLVEKISTKTSRRYVDYLFPNFAERFLNAVNQKTFGNQFVLFNKCQLTGQPCFEPENTINLNSLSKQQVDRKFRNQLDAHRGQYFNFFKRCFQIQGSYIFIDLTYTRKQQHVMSLRYYINSFTENCFVKHSACEAYTQAPNKIQVSNNEISNEPKDLGLLKLLIDCINEGEAETKLSKPLAQKVKLSKPPGKPGRPAKATKYQVEEELEPKKKRELGVEQQFSKFFKSLKHRNQKDASETDEKPFLDSD